MLKQHGEVVDGFHYMDFNLWIMYVMVCNYQQSNQARLKVVLLQLCWASLINCINRRP